MSRFECSVPATSFFLNKESNPELANAILTQLGYYWLKLSEQKVWKYSVMDKQEFTNKDFINLVFNTNLVFILTTDTKHMYEPVGHAILRPATKQVALGDFGVNRKYFEHGQEIFDTMVDFVFNWNFASTLIAMTPIFNWPAMKVAKAKGFRYIDTIKDAYYFAAKDRLVDAKLGVLNKNGDSYA